MMESPNPSPAPRTAFANESWSVPAAAYPAALPIAVPAGVLDNPAPPIPPATEPTIGPTSPRTSIKSFDVMS